MKQKENLIPQWNEKAQSIFKGKRIIEVRYLNDDEMERMDWYSRPLLFLLEDGTEFFISSDNEGNDGGAVFYGDMGVMPTI